MLTGKHILIVEDEPIIALDLETVVRDQHGVVVGPVGNVTEAIRIAETVPLDGAILDLQIRHEVALPVAEVLRARHIPFIIHSGQADITVPSDWPEVALIGKPSPAEHVIQRLAELIDKRTT